MVPQVVPFDARAKENAAGDKLLKHRIVCVITTSCIVITIAFNISVLKVKRNVELSLSMT